MNCSYTEIISISWLRVVVLLLLLLMFFWTAVTCFDMILGKSVYYVSSVIIFSYIFVRTMRHHVVSVSDMLTPFAYKVDGESGSEQETMRFVEELHRAMNEQHLYLNPLLTLPEVAMVVGTNRTYLSEYLNRELKISFYDYVNGFRVREAERILLQNHNFKVDEIATKCGFNSRSTFLRAFEKVNGTTPAKFRAERIA